MREGGREVNTERKEAEEEEGALRLTPTADECETEGGSR